MKTTETEMFNGFIAELEIILGKLKAKTNGIISTMEMVDYEKLEALMDVLNLGDKLREKLKENGFTSWKNLYKKNRENWNIYYMQLAAIHGSMIGFVNASIKYLERIKDEK